MRWVPECPPGSTLVVGLRPGAGDGGPDAVGGSSEELALLVAEGATGAFGQLHTVLVDGRRVQCLGLGAVEDPTLTPLRWRRLGAALGRRCRDDASLALALMTGPTGGPAGPAPGELGNLVEGLLLASYSFTLKATPRTWALAELLLLDPAPGLATAGAVARAELVARATHLARDLQNTPSLLKTPAWLADRAVAVGAEAGLAVEVLDEHDLLEQGFGGVSAVGRASARPPRLVRLRYEPAGRVGRRTPHVVLVGKGVTFDSGGLSLKPSDGMVAMKTDMSGAAVVIAVASALAEAGVRVRVTAVAPMAENLPGADALRPGDVVTHWPGIGRGGRTTEVLNTDAEGRLLLADALASSAAELAPTHLVDVATLTGAMTLALGRRTGGFFCSSDAMAADLLAAADTAGERLWRMPLVEDYRDGVDSPIADLLNTGDRALGYSGGAITAALFLREFTAGLPWAHFDIAGAARSDSDTDEITKGGTGYAVATLLAWLCTLA